ncbi:unnamed protein product [Porites lobata]|uniref:G-protein coupled receptors family 1 profile domain-containing protein n=1 Tax=Porites lobata TaxID=104759 RepID=A0ABN8P2S3_9CNID|nr:unnamed protein product [Porites lobata]
MANNSQIGSSSHDPLKRSYSQIGLEVALAILISLMSFLGNLLVVYVVHKDSRLKSLTNIFIQNLALTDIAMATLHMPYWVISLYTGTWIFSETWCDFQALIEATLGIASILNMGLIAFNRYIRVVKPAQLYSRLFPSKKMARVYSALVWISSMLLASPPLYGWGKMVYHPTYAICSFNWEIEHISYVIILVGGVNNTTTIAIFYCYYKIYKTLKESSNNLNALSTDDGAIFSGRPRADIRVLKTSFTVVCVFLIIWGPVTVVVVMESAEYFVAREVSTAVFFLMFTGSLVNPFIYGIMNPQLRAAFKRALSFGRCDNNQVIQIGQPQSDEAI